MPQDLGFVFIDGSTDWAMILYLHFQNDFHIGSCKMIFTKVCFKLIFTSMGISEMILASIFPKKIEYLQEKHFIQALAKW